jgi:uncharacterized lipoprotein YddW (UPF0748 family)
MRSKLSFLITPLLFCQGFIFGQHNGNALEIDLTSEIVAPKHYIIPKATSPITVDGFDNDSAWSNTIYTDAFIDIEGKKDVPYQTRVKMLWDEDFLYFFAEIEEPHIWGDIKKRDAIIYYNNDFEVFIDPSNDTRNYGEIEINALNTVWDLQLDKPYRVGGKAEFYWNLPELQSAVQVFGTLNNPSDIDSMWTLELAVPMNSMVELKNKPRTKPKEGEIWRINFSRVEWDHDINDGVYSRKKENGNYLPEYNWVWSNQGVINMHEPEKWGYLQFTEKGNSSDVHPIKEEDEIYIQALYSIFRKVHKGELSYLKLEEAGSETLISARLSKSEKVSIRLHKTNIAYEISLTSPLSRIEYWINASGELSKHPEKEIINLPAKKFIFATWAHGDQTFNSEKWNKKLDNYKALGITEVLIGGSAEFLQPLVNLAATKDMKIHAWMWTLNRPGDSTCMQHPEWYSVNRKGDNSLDYRAYVDYYQWLSPFHPEAREYIKGNVQELTKVKGLASIHLDYVRYVDVILGAQLQPKYGLVQDHEMPEYDYGYHPLAIKAFKKQFGYSPLELKNPELSAEWRQFRLDAITSLVNECVALADEAKVNITAAVFPYPEMSRHMVRQAWDDWNLDAAYPMLYQNFYNESIEWIGFATKTDVNKVDFPIIAGLYLPAFKNAKELEKGILQALYNGANGVSLFQADNLTEEQQEVMKKLNQQLNN